MSYNIINIIYIDMIFITMIYNHNIDIIFIHYVNEYTINLSIHNFFFISKVACPLISTFTNTTMPCILIYEQTPFIKNYYLLAIIML